MIKRCKRWIGNILSWTSGKMDKKSTEKSICSHQCWNLCNKAHKFTLNSYSSGIAFVNWNFHWNINATRSAILLWTRCSSFYDFPFTFENLSINSQLSFVRLVQRALVMNEVCFDKSFYWQNFAICWNFI